MPSARFAELAYICRRSAPPIQDMKHTTTLLFFATVLFSCQNESRPGTDDPSLFREKPAPATTVSEPLPLPKTGAGNFESLVADYEDKVSLAQVERELVAAGFKVTKIDKDVLDYQYIILAQTY